MFLLISRNYKPDFEMLVEGIFSTREKAIDFLDKIKQWKMENGIYNDDHFIWETPVDPEIPEESYYNVKQPFGSQEIIVTPMSFFSNMWLINQGTELNKVIEGLGWWIMSSLVKAHSEHDAKIKADKLFKEHLVIKGKTLSNRTTVVNNFR
jgi:hypothetical protein